MSSTEGGALSPSSAKIEEHQYHMEIWLSEEDKMCNLYSGMYWFFIFHVLLIFVLVLKNGWLVIWLIFGLLEILHSASGFSVTSPWNKARLCYL